MFEARTLADRHLVCLRRSTPVSVASFAIDRIPTQTQMRARANPCPWRYSQVASAINRLPFSADWRGRLIDSPVIAWTAVDHRLRDTAPANIGHFGHFGSPAVSTNPRAIQSDDCANGNEGSCLFDPWVSEGKDETPDDGFRDLWSAAPHPGRGRLSPNWGLFSRQAVPRVCFSGVVAALLSTRRLKNFFHLLRPRREQRVVLTTRKTPLETLGKPSRMRRFRHGHLRGYRAPEQQAP